jgi:outer membrane protein assembly factor BamA
MSDLTRRAGKVALGCVLAGTTPAHAQVNDSTPNSASTGLGRFFPIPVVFYQPETGWGFGGALLHTLRLARDARTSTNFMALVYTVKKQYSASLQSELYSAGDRFVLVGELMGSHFPDKFYGLGNETLADTSDDYTLDQARVALEGRVRIEPHVYLGPTVLYQWTDVKDSVAGGLLTPAISGTAGGTISGVGAGLVVDTRDNTLAPRHGAFAVLRARWQDGAIGSDYDYLRYELDVRGYLPIVRGHVLALQAIATGNTGEPPFFDLAKLGGANVFRGSYEGRFRDRQRMAVQTEYRMPVWGPVGVTVFGSAGQVLRSWGDFRAGDLHYAGGGGIRVRLSKADRVNLRVDLGFGPGESGVYFALGEAF